MHSSLSSTRQRRLAPADTSAPATPVKQLRPGKPSCAGTSSSTQCRCIRQPPRDRRPLSNSAPRLQGHHRSRSQHHWQTAAAEQAGYADVDRQLAEVNAEMREQQSEMEAAVAAEDYQSAAAVRDALDSLMLRRRRLELVQGEEAKKVKYKLGQVMLHKRYEYRGVIFGMDAVCRADERWIRAMGVHNLPHGAQQPFYHVMVDEKDRPGGHTTYVAQENILPAEGPRAKEISHPGVKKAFQAFEGGSYVARSELQDQYKQSLQASEYAAPEE